MTDIIKQGAHDAHANSMLESHSWKVLEAYFRSNNLVLNQLETFNDFIQFGIQDIIDQDPLIAIPNYSVRFGQITVSNPVVIEEDRTMKLIYPSDARLRDLSYDGAILCNITEKFTDLDGKEVLKEHPRVTIGRIPIMVRSATCNLNSLSADECLEKGECPNDYGGYFIVRGNEHVLVGQMRAAYNKIFVLKQKPGDKYKYIAETRSMSNETGHSVLIQCMIGADDRTILFSIPYIKEPIPAGILFKALGFTSEENIVRILGLTESKTHKYIRYIIRDSWLCQTKQDALEYIGNRAMHIITEEKKRDYAWQVVETELLPHLGISGTIHEQACFLGYMLRMLIHTNAGLRHEDDRDNLSNKRVEVAGTLLYEIFRNLYKKYVLFIKTQLEKRKQRPDILTIILRTRSITKGLHTCISTGNWGVQKNASYMRTGVSQILDRMTYCATLSHLRRVLIPVGKEGKNTAIRQIHPSSFGIFCPCETPEGLKIGIVLNLALLTKITKKIPTVVVRKVLDNCSTIQSVQSLVEDGVFSDLSDYYPIFLNGGIIGYTVTPEECVKEIKELRACNVLHKEVSITLDTLDKLILVYCDEGRFTRPLLTLTNNELNIRKEIELQLEQGTEVRFKWKRLLKRGYVEYVDASELENSVIAMKPELLQVQKSDYCEIHPSTMLGIMAALIPFPDHSQSPRNCYQCLWVEEEVLMADLTRKRIGDVKIGESIITVDPKTCKQSVTKVINQYVKPTEKDIVKLTTITGRSVVCTTDHPILTFEGWKEAGKIKLFEGVCVFSDGLLGEWKRYKNFIKPHTLSFNKWCKVIKTRGNAMFIPVNSIQSHSNVMISDITTESNTHSFITGGGICVHNSSMGKQALGVPLLSYNLRADTLLHVLHYPQKPLVSTKYANMTGVKDMPSGINAIVAILAYTGYNQEDSVMFNLSAIQRGLFCLTSYHTIDCCEKKRETYSFEEICLPPENNLSVQPGQPGYFRRENANYSLLDENGIIRERTHTGGSVTVKKGDVLIGKVIITGSKTGEESKVDASVIVQPGEEGVIDRVITSITPNGYKLVKVVIRVIREPTLGDKVASRAAQKGTIGMVYRQEDLPFSKDGIVPDIIINPLCLSGNTIVSLRGNGSERIDSMVKNVDSYEVETVCPAEFKRSTTKISDPQVSDSSKRRMVKVQTWSGRSVVCTSDHPFLIAEETWQHAEDLKPNQDMLTILHSTRKLSESGAIPVLNLENKNYGNTLKEFKLTEEKLQILARLLGAIETDGHISIRNEESMTFRAQFHLGEEKDVEDLCEDVCKLGFPKPTYRLCTTKMNGVDYATTYTVEVAPALGFVLFRLGAHPGRGSTAEKRFPKWLATASLEVQRQFLCGFQGGDGSYISVNEKTVQQQVRIKPTKQTADNDVLQFHKEYMEGISKLFANLGVNSTICIEQPKDENKKEVALRISVKMDNVERYADLIDYAYCNHKQRRSRLAIEFVRLRNRGFRIPFEKMKEFQRGDTIAVYVDKVEEVEYNGDVYDFATISANHSFVANSIVVHNCIPSRMTVNQLIECALGKECSISGTYADATPFTEESVNRAEKLVKNIQEKIGEYGFESHGWETLMNGMTGEMINAKVFMGPTYYQRLKHMVDDKMHARARGSVTMLTRQPNEGRSRDGPYQAGRKTICIFKIVIFANLKVWITIQIIICQM